ncbi:hypothetical protein N431DRAFT_484404 [Stipitochalara longipes BDJ]|nr:hypothetical protein N431DRAFT_484404 [Stipitochalara longipes BDJ]
MFISAIAILYGAHLAAAAATPACAADNCLRAVRASAFPTRLGTADCSSYFLTTVTGGSTVAPSAIPTYASACSGSARYSSACSCVGVTASTIAQSVTVPPYGISTPIPTATYTAPPDTYATPAPTISPSNVLPATTNSANIAASTQKPIQFGFTNDDGTNFYYNANLTAKDGSVLVNLEQIIPFISSIICPRGSSGSIDISFTSANEYNIAAGSWPTTFQLMTSGAAYCGSDDGRTFYSVASVDFTSATNSVTLGVTSTTIGHAVDGVQALWGTTGTPSPARKYKRDSGSSSTVITLNPNNFPSFFDFGSIINGADFPGIGTSPIQCEGCGIYGTITLSGGYDCTLANFCTGGTFISADFQNIDIVADFDYSTDGGYSVSKTFVLDEVPLPAISIPDLLSITPSAQLIATLGVAATGNIFELHNIGFNATIPDASLGVYFFDSPATTSNGWSLASAHALTPGFDYNTVNEFDFSASIGPTVGLDMEFWSFDYSASLTLQSPLITAKFTQDRNYNCGVPDAVSSYEFTLDSELKFFASVTGPDVPSSLGEVDFFDLNFPIIQNPICVPY